MQSGILRSGILRQDQSGLQSSRYFFKITSIKSNMPSYELLIETLSKTKLNWHVKAEYWYFLAQLGFHLGEQLYFKTAYIAYSYTDG